MATAKPTLSLSVSSSHAPESAIASSSRRITSWGSATSDTPSFNGLADRHMTPLPSPSGTREWGYLGNDGWNAGRSIGRASSQHGSRGKAVSIFEEMREGSPFDHYGPAFPSETNGRLPTKQEVDGRPIESDEPGSSSTPAPPPPTRSKTLDFFGTSSDALTPILSPPPNPLSRASSLRKEHLPLSPESSTRPSSLAVSGGRDRASSTSSISSWLDRADIAAAVTSPTSTPSARWAARSRLSEIERLSLEPSNSSGSSSDPIANGNQPASASPGRGPAHALGLSEPGSHSSAVPFSGSTGHSEVLRDVSASSGPTAATSMDHEGPADRGAPPTPQIIPNASNNSISSGISREARPSTQGDTSSEEATVFKPGDQLGDFTIERMLGKGTFSRVALGRRRILGGDATSRAGQGDVYALKIVSKKSYEDNERMRISIVREIEVLKTIHHPSLVSLASSFTTPLYTVLVLDYCPGGELFDFIAQWHDSFFDGLVRRIFGELCAAVGWMHRIGLVHRDIKLENIVVVARPFPSSASPREILDGLPRPFVKLTDFGLSRFLDLRSPMLTTRCGSEAYASPELIMGKPYDGRRTDAWALGVVLYALITGVLPFVENERTSTHGDARKSRRAYLLKIAKGEYAWPAQAHLASPAVQRVVAQLLVRDPGRRALVDDVWDMDFMQGEGMAERVDGHISARSLSTIENWQRRGSAGAGEPVRE